MSLTDFLSMGGFAKYVWSSYGICAVVLTLNIVIPLLNERKTMRDLQKRLHNKKSN